MELHVDLRSRRDIAGQVYRGIRAAILDGRLRPGDRVPPTRELAARLEVSRNTVGVAYEYLAAEELLAARGAAGSFVTGELRRVDRSRGTRSGGAQLQSRGIWSALPGPPGLQTTPPYDFRAGMPDARLFPFDTWRRLVARQLRVATLPATYGEPGGHPGLRASVARHAGVARGVRASADDVIVTSGAQQALDLIGRVLLEPGTRVAVEDPGYPPARLLFQSLGARVVSVPVDAAGLEVAALPDDVRLVYVTPSHQFPLGMPMSPERRSALLAWAEKQDAILIEDDYDSEFRFQGRPIETLHGLDRCGRVIYVGSFSKVMLPALRLGFLVAPPSLQRALLLAKLLTDWHTDLPAQAALARFIDEGLLAQHIRKMRREYQARYERIRATLTHDFSAWLRLVPSVAGLHLSAMLRQGSRKLERDIVARANAAGVGLRGLSDFYVNRPGRPGLVFGYGGVPMGKIEEGLRRLRACLASANRARG